MYRCHRARFAIVSCLIALLFDPGVILSENPEKQGPDPLKKPTTNPSYAPITIGSVFSYYGNNGDGSNNFAAGTSGFEYPKGSGKTAVFEDGIVWGGYQGGTGIPKVGGSVYRHGVQPGPILTYGTPTSSPIPDDPATPSNRVYRVRTDITPSTPAYLALELITADELPYRSRFEFVTAQGIYDQYMTDWKEWPAALGAPFTYGNDAFGVQRTSGPYDWQYDTPGRPGAAQTLWYVANDVNPSLVSSLSGSSPIGLEMQRSICGYAGGSTLGNVILQSTILINKSGIPVDSMYIVQWADPDLGTATDDYMGCDTSLSLAYAYNGMDVDAIYGSNVPAVGFSILQGPRVPSPGDSALFLGRRVHGFKNLPMSAAVMFINGNATYLDPPQGGTGYLNWYNLMRGRISTSGAPFINPNTGNPTKFVFSGDPVKGTGWLASQSVIPTDVRLAMVTGPFTLAAADTQEIVVANLIEQGGNRLSSITSLKYMTEKVRSVALGGVFAHIDPVDTLYAVGDNVLLHGSANSFLPVTALLSWQLLSKPGGSAADLTPSAGSDTKLTVDVAGQYVVRLLAQTSGGSDTTSVTINVTGTKRPIAAFSIPASVILGDSVTIDGSASSDPNGKPITLSWTVSGSRGFDQYTPRDSMSGTLTSSNAAVTRFYPLRTALHSVLLEVSNGTFTSTMQKTFQVEPLASPQIHLRSEHMTGTLPWGNAEGFAPPGWYGWGGIREIDGAIWVNDGGTCAQVNFNDYSQPAQIYNMYGLLFDGGNNYLVSAFTNTAYVAKTDGNGHVLSMGYILPFQTYSADSAIAGVVFRYPYAILRCLKAGLLIYDVTNPVSSVKVFQFNDGDYWGSNAADGNYLYSTHPLTNRIAVVDISTPSAIVSVKTIQLDRSYTGCVKVGQYFYLTKTNSAPAGTPANNDTIAVYDFSDLNNPVRKCFIPVPKTFNPNNRFHAVSGYGSFMMASTAEGVYVYDVSNPSQPVLSGHFLTGSYHGVVFMNATRMLTVNLNRGGYTGSYEGLLDLESPFTSVDQGSEKTLPLVVGLGQNYPNPFNPSTVIDVQLPAASDVRLVVYDMLGREVSTLVDGRLGAGVHSVTFNARTIASGVYFYRLETTSADASKGNHMLVTKKMVLVK